jgi:hypothetical protein
VLCDLAADSVGVTAALDKSTASPDNLQTNPFRRRVADDDLLGIGWELECADILNLGISGFGQH